MLHVSQGLVRLASALLSLERLRRQEDFEKEASAIGGAGSSLEELLFHKGYQFEFFQAVRLTMRRRMTNNNAAATVIAAGISPMRA